MFDHSKVCIILIVIQVHSLSCKSFAGKHELVTKVI